MVCGVTVCASLRQLTLMHLQLVVFGKAHHKIPGHHVVDTQVGMHDHAAHVVDAGGHAPGGISKVAAAVVMAVWAKLAHHTRQTLGPVAGAEGAAVQRGANDVDFF